MFDKDMCTLTLFQFPYYRCGFGLLNVYLATWIEVVPRDTSSANFRFITVSPSISIHLPSTLIFFECILNCRWEKFGRYCMSLPYSSHYGYSCRMSSCLCIRIMVHLNIRFFYRYISESFKCGFVFYWTKCLLVIYVTNEEWNIEFIASNDDL